MGIILIDSMLWEKMNIRFSEFIHSLNKQLGTNNQQVEWLDNADVCKLLNVSKRSLQTYRNTGKLPFSQINHKVYYKRTDVEEFLNKDNYVNINNKNKLNGK